MNSLKDLSNHNKNFQLHWIDERSAKIVFSNAAPINQTIYVNEGHDHILPLGIDILDIVQGETLNIALEVDTTHLPGSEVQWATLPSGVTSSIVGNTYRLSNITTIDQWNIIKAPTIKSSLVGFGDYYYISTISYSSSYKTWTITTHIVEGIFFESFFTLSSVATPLRYGNAIFNSLFNAILNGNAIVSSGLAVNAVASFFASGVKHLFSVTNASSFSYTSGSTELITGNPTVSNTDGFTITATIQPTGVFNINTITTAGSGGTVNFDNINKILTITGSYTQVNSHINTMSISSVDRYDYKFSITYTITENLSGSTPVIKYQNMNPVPYIFDTISDGTYNIADFLKHNTAIPAIYDSTAGNFTYEIYPQNSSDIIDAVYIPSKTTSYSTSSGNHLLWSTDYVGPYISGDGHTAIGGYRLGSVLNIYKKTYTGAWTLFQQIPSASISTGGISFDGSRFSTVNQIYSLSGSSYILEKQLSSSPYYDVIKISFDGIFATSRNFNNNYLEIYKRTNNTWDLIQTISTPHNSVQSCIGKDVIYINTDLSSKIISKYRYNSSTNQFDLETTYTSTYTVLEMACNYDGSCFCYKSFVGTTHYFKILSVVGTNWTEEFSYSGSSWTSTTVPLIMSSDGSLVFLQPYSLSSPHGRVYKKIGGTWTLIYDIANLVSISEVGNGFLSSYSLSTASEVYQSGTINLWNYDASTKKIKIVTDKTTFNNMRNDIKFLTSDGFSSTIDMRYKVTNPAAAFSYTNNLLTGI